MTNNSRYCRRAGIALALLCLLTACGDGPDEALAPGEGDYRKFCSTCHGVDGAGRPPSFPPLVGSEWLDMGPDAVALVVLLGLKGEIEVAGRTYRGYMPAMNQLSDAEIAGILEYLVGAGWATWPSLPDAERIASLRKQAEALEMFEGRDELEAALEEIEP